jgi:hypothetical protein
MADLPMEGLAEKTDIIARLTNSLCHGCVPLVNRGEYAT